MQSGIVGGVGTGIGTGLNPAGGFAVRPATAAEWDAKHPTIATPEALWPHMALSSPSPDTINSHNLIASFTPAFSDTGITMDSSDDYVALAASSQLDPDGATDMTYYSLVDLPSYSGAEPGIFSKRGGVGFAGFSLYMQAGGNIKVVQDGGASGRLDFANTGDYQNRTVALSYTINRTTNLGTIHTPDDSVTGSIATIASMANTEKFALGHSDPENRLALVGSRHIWSFCIVGTAITRAEFLAISNL